MCFMGANMGNFNWEKNKNDEINSDLTRTYTAEVLL